MLTRRIIPCLDVKDGRVVKGKKFADIKDVDSPGALAKFYLDSGADELVFYDITASSDKRKTSLKFIKKVADIINIPFCVGGGVKSLNDFDIILKSGADKVSINSSAVKTPELIKEASLKYGNQCVVVSMDVKKNKDNKTWNVYINGGRVNTGLDAFEWAKKVLLLGAGELVINSIDEDGMKNGYDIELLSKITKIVNIPVIASGGAGKLVDFLNVIKYANVDGLLAASVFHYKEIQINDLKKYLKSENIEVRL